MRLDAASLFARLGGGPLTVERAAPDTYDVHGRLVAGGVTTSTVTAAVQPVTGEDLRRLPEGLRASAAVTVWAAGELQLGDVLVYEGRRYSVGHVEKWFAASYWRAVATEEG